MLDAALIFGVLCACVGACYGRRASWALLLSAALGLALNELGMPFILPMWFAIDLVVALAIIWPHWNPRDWPHGDMLVLSCFPPLWVTYITDGWTGYIASVLIASLQMVLTFPARRAWDDAHWFVNKHRGNRENDMRVAHA